MRETGWAKINLALHVRARRSDGYHEIETLFAFVDGGDTIAATMADADALTIDGEFAAGLSAGAVNLVLRVLALLRDRYGVDRVPPLAVRLTKALPVAAGVGGGLADARSEAGRGGREGVSRGRSGWQLEMEKQNKKKKKQN